MELEEQDLKDFNKECYRVRDTLCDLDEYEDGNSIARLSADPDELIVKACYFLHHYHDLLNKIKPTEYYKILRRK